MTKSFLKRNQVCVYGLKAGSSPGSVVLIDTIVFGGKLHDSRHQRDKNNKLIKNKTNSTAKHDKKDKRKSWDLP